MFFQSCAQSKESEDKKINIPGTRVFLTVPDGFFVSKSMTGLEKNKDVGISVMDLNEGNYYTNTATFTKSNWQSKGIIVVSFEEHTIGNFPAKTVHLKTFETEGFVLVFGDSTFSTMITGMTLPDDSVSLNQIKNCLESVFYDKSLVVNPLDFAKFELKTNDSKYKFAKSSANMYVYSVDGMVKDSYQSESYFMVSQIPYVENQMTPKSIAQEMLQSQEQYGLSFKKPDTENTNKINGYDAYETYYKGILNGEEIYIYLLIVAKENNAFTCIGMAYNDFEKNLIEFKKLGHSIRIKY